MSCRTSFDKDDFVEATSDFLEPMSESDIACAMNVCEDNGSLPQTTCTPKPFKCKFGPNFVMFTAFDEDEIAQKRKECAACDDINVEPVGGQGGWIRTPIRDDVEAADVFVRKHGLHRRLKTLWILLALLVLFLIFQLMKK